MYENFNFKYIPLKNDLYNLSTNQIASNFKFPYKENEFDLVVLTSVFTHMQHDEVKNYLSEISRVLKPGKHCFCTFFLITPESDLFLNTTPDPLFKYKYDNYYLHHPTVKDANIAYKYEAIESFVNASGLTIKNFYPGWWVGKTKDECMNFQDVLVLKKN